MEPVQPKRTVSPLAESVTLRSLINILKSRKRKAMQITNKSERYTWKQFGKDINGLNWYDVVTSFIFRFFAKTSEPLLAAGIIISAIDFLQRGQLLAHNAELSLWWSIAQGVAMEVSVGHKTHGFIWVSVKPAMELPNCKRSIAPPTN